MGIERQATGGTAPAGRRGMRLLIGYDGSECARAAIRELPRAYLGEAGEARVVSVADITAAVPSPVLAPVQGEGLGAWDRGAAAEADAIRLRAESRAEKVAREGTALAADSLLGWRVGAESFIDSPYWGLIRSAAEWPADLIVVGSHGRSAIGRAVLGSVSGYVLSHAPCSVRIGRPGREVRSTAPGDALRIIVGADGSEGARAALRVVGARRWPAGTEIRVVTAVDERLATAVAAYAGWLVDRERRASGIRQTLDAVVDDLQRAGLKVSAAVLEGDPKRVLVEVAEEWRADCVFVGARGHSRLERFLLGSVAAAVAARAPCSVEMVR